MNNFTDLDSSNGDFSKEGSTFFALNDWFNLLVSELNPDFVVGIARSAIRILQLTNSDKIVNGKLLSQNALPFISDEEIKGKIVLLFDDSIIYGSTLSKIRDYLLQRGAIIHCASFIVDKEVFYGERKTEPPNPSKFSNIPIDYKQKLPSAAVKKHHYSLIKSVLRSSRDYNLDFPTAQVNISEYESHDIPFLLYLFKKKMPFINEIVDVTTPLSAEAGIYRYTVLFNGIEKGIFSSEKIQYLTGSKMRLTFIPETNEIRIKFLPQFAVENGLLFSDVSFFDERFAEYWKGFSIAGKDDSFYNQSLHRLITVFAATIYSHFSLGYLSNAFREEFPVVAASLDDEDILINLGLSNFLNLKGFWHSLPELDLKFEDFTARKPIKLETDKKLLSDVKQEWIDSPNLKPEKEELPYESLSKILISVNRVTDSPERRKQNPDADRIEVGLTFYDIEEVLAEESILFKPEAISTALDVCVDYGQAVPKVILRGNYWVRASYSGETKDAQNLIQLRDALHQAYSDFLTRKGAKPLNRYDVQKLCTSIKEVVRWIPVSSNFSTFGRVASIERTPDSRGQQNIIDWLQHGLYPAFEERIVGGKKGFLPVPDYSSAVFPVWSNNELIEFFDAFDYLATAFQSQNKKSDSDLIKLLLSTCRNHEHTCEAVITEAYNWIYDKKTNGFDDLLGNVKQALPKNIFKDYAIEKLYWCITFLNEAHKKYQLFYNQNQFTETQTRLRDALLEQGSGAERFWKFKVKPLLDPRRDIGIEDFFTVLKPLLILMERLTSIVARSLIDFGILSADELKTEFREKGLLIEKVKWLNLKNDVVSLTQSYNVALNDRDLNRAIINRQFSRSDASEKFNLLDACNDCYMQIKDAMFCLFYPYEAVEGGFCYIPKGKVQVRKDGRVVRRKKGIYILTTDIIGSKGSPEAEQMNDITLNYLKKQLNIFYEETGNDAYTICSDDPKTLWYIARDLSFQAARIRTNESRFKGIRKAVIRGDVSIITDEKKTIIRDIQRQDSLPQAVYLLEAFKEKNDLAKLGEDDHNSIIVFESKTAEELAKVLDLPFNKEATTSLDTKHFTGSFVFFRQRLEPMIYE